MTKSFSSSLLRKMILDMAYIGSSAHIGCAFSIVEILSVLYSKHLHYPNDQSDHPLRDYFVLSKGHGIMAQYACIAQKGWIDPHELEHYLQDGTRLHGLSEAGVPGVEVTSGSLGHGLSVGAGLALAAKRRNTGQRCYTIIGDGEANEGSVWEALLFAAQLRLDNLVVIIDKNDFQAMGRTSEILEPGDWVTKLQAFGFQAKLVNGHNEAAIDASLAGFNTQLDGRPKALVAQTMKGKGVSFMENNNLWHYTRLSPETYAAASLELTGSKA